MKILVICQYYYPEPFRISDICEELVKCGNDVSVVTGIPNYPMGKVYDGYKGKKHCDEVISGVRVHRCFTIERKHGTIYRFLNYYSYVVSSMKYVSKLEDDYDVVFVNQLSPVMMAEAGIRYKKKFGKKLVLYCLDLWPESLAAGGIKRDSIVYKAFFYISKRIYRSADKVLITSKSFSKYFKDMFKIKDVKYIPQYAETLFNPDICKKVPSGTIDLMFAGNLGSAQGVEVIIKAAKLTAEIKNLHWHIVGDGSEFERIKELSTGLDNLTLHGRKSLNEMPKYYSMADAMLVTMKKDEFLSLTLPGKVQTYMAAGKPIIGAIDGETQEVICESNCGLCGKAENEFELVDNVKIFMKTMNVPYGNNAYQYYEKNFSKNKFIENLISSFK